MPEKQDQWKQGGDCNLCRRAPYCHNKCKAHQEKQNKELSEIATKVFTDAYERVVAPNLHKHF